MKNHRHKTGDELRLIEALLTRPATTQRQTLDRLCEKYPENARELRRLYSSAAEFAALDGSVPNGTNLSAPSRHLGEFELLDQIGGGGMGIVYRARQASVDREIALKIIRPEYLYFPGARSRFRREIDAIGNLQHPGIVPVIASGEENGVPYFAMELIAGMSLERALEWLVPQKAKGQLTGRSLQNVLSESDEDLEPGHLFHGSWPDLCCRLVRQIAEALAHAHARGIFHRDVKPSNILVSPSGRAMLIDFGLSRRDIDPRVTRTGRQVGSVPYMAPEVLLGSRNHDAAPDLYSLGVTFYELLTLNLPFEGETNESLRTAILEGRPKPPRIHLPDIPWEVETVCLAAMERDPTRRYPNAGELAQDLTLALYRRPILARRASPALRLRRWIQRRPAATIAAILTFLLLVVGPLVFGILQHLHARDLGRASREKGVLRSQHEDELAILLSQALAQATRQGFDPPATTFIDLISNRVVPSLEIATTKRVSLLLDLGWFYLRMGDAERAANPVETADQLLSETVEDNRGLRARAAEQLGYLRRCQGRSRDAVELYKQALLFYSSPPGDRSRIPLSCEIGFARALRENGEPRAALDVARQAASTASKKQGLPITDRIEVDAALIELTRGMGDYSEAERICRASLETLRATEKEHVFGEQRLRALLSETLADQHRSQEAWSELKRLQDLQERIAPRHSSMIAHTLANKARVARQMSKPEEAERYYREALGIHRSLPESAPLETAVLQARYADFLLRRGGNQLQISELLHRSLETFRTLGVVRHHHYLECLATLAVVEASQGSRAQAKAHLETVRDLTKELWSEPHPALARVHHLTGWVQSTMGLLDQAEESWRASLAINQSFFGRQSALAASDIQALAECLLNRESIEEAYQLAQEVTSILDRGNGPTIQLARSLSTRGRIAIRRGDLPQAQADFLRALELFRQVDSVVGQINTLTNLVECETHAKDWNRAMAHADESFELGKESKISRELEAIGQTNQATVLLAMGEFQEARVRLEQSLGLLEACPEANPRQIARVQSLLGRNLLHLGSSADSEVLLNQALEILRAELPPEHPDLLLVQSLLAISFAQQGRIGEARQLLRKSLETMKHVLGPNHPQTSKIHLALLEFNRSYPDGSSPD